MLLTFMKPKFEGLIKENIKQHTIRADKSSRWKVGNSIQFWNGNPRNVPAKHKPYQFGTGVCSRIEKIEFHWWKPEHKELYPNPFDDIENEDNETFTVTLSPIAGSNLGTITQYTVTISDDDSNSAPAVTLSENREVNTGATVNITATAADNENDPMTYLWQQTAGTSITLNNATNLTANFVAPTVEGDVVLSFTATDSKGLSSEASITLTVIAVPVALPTPTPITKEDKSSGSGSLGYLILTLTLVFIRRQYK